MRYPLPGESYRWVKRRDADFTEVTSSANRTVALKEIGMRRAQRKLWTDFSTRMAGLVI